MQNHDGVIRPSYALHHREQISFKDGTVPGIDLTSVTGLDELPPVHPTAPLMYQKLHPGLESWTIFRLLP